MKPYTLFAGIALACTICSGAQAAGTAPAAKPRVTEPAPKPHAAAEPAQREVAYADLGKEIGKRVIVHTKFNTTRSGVLVRHSASQIDLKLDSGAELSVPVESIKHVGVAIAPPDPLVPKAADGKAGEAKATDAKPAAAKSPGKPADAKPAADKAGDKPAKASDGSAKKN